MLRADANALQADVEQMGIVRDQVRASPLLSDLVTRIDVRIKDVQDKREADAICEVPLEALGLTTRAHNGLKSEGIESVGEARAALPYCRRFASFGNVAYNDFLRSALRRYDGEPDPAPQERLPAPPRWSRREQALIETMGLTPEKAAELLSRGGA